MTPDKEVIRDILEAGRGQTPLETHSETIYNVAEVEAALRGTRFEHMLRLAPRLNAAPTVGAGQLPGSP